MAGYSRAPGRAPPGVAGGPAAGAAARLFFKKGGVGSPCSWLAGPSSSTQARFCVATVSFCLLLHFCVEDPAHCFEMQWSDGPHFSPHYSVWCIVFTCFWLLLPPLLHIICILLMKSEVQKYSTSKTNLKQHFYYIILLITSVLPNSHEHTKALRNFHTGMLLCFSFLDKPTSPLKIKHQT